MILTYIKDIDIKGLRFPKIINCNSNKFFILGSKQELNENNKIKYLINCYELNNNIECIEKRGIILDFSFIDNNYFILRGASFINNFNIMTYLKWKSIK